MINLRDRIIDFQRIKAAELMDNDGNWRMHPQAQAEAMDGILAEIGIADSLLAYYSKRNDGKLTLIDGHLRKSRDPEQIWPTQITDLTDEEADLLLSILDPLAGMAKMDGEKFIALQDRVTTDEWAVREALRNLTMDAEALLAEEDDDDETDKDKSGPDNMELLPFEHYDYILVMFKNELDWLRAIDIFGLERKTDPRRTKKVGFSRVIDGAKVIKLINQLQGNDVDENSHTE